MSDRGSELEAARRAKDAVRAATAGWPELVGIGITEARGRFAVKVDLSRPLPPERTGGVPTELEGIAIVIEVVGGIGPI